MSATVRQQIVTALMTALTTNPPAGVPICTRGNSIDEAPASLPTLQLVRLHDKVLEARDQRPAGRGPIMHRRMALGAVAWVAKGSLSADDATDPILAWVETCVAGLHSVVNVQRAFVEEATWTVGSGQETYGRLLAAVVVEYQHKVGDPTAWA